MNKKKVEAGVKAIHKFDQCPCCGYSGYWSLEKKRDGTYGPHQSHIEMQRKLVTRILKAAEKVQ